MWCRGAPQGASYCASVPLLECRATLCWAGRWIRARKKLSVSVKCRDPGCICRYVCLPQSTFIFVFLYFVGWEALVFPTDFVCKAELSLNSPSLYLDWPGCRSSPQLSKLNRSGCVNVFLLLIDHGFFPGHLVVRPFAQSSWERCLHSSA